MDKADTIAVLRTWQGMPEMNIEDKAERVREKESNTGEK